MQNYTVKNNVLCSSKSSIFNYYCITIWRLYIYYNPDLFFLLHILLVLLFYFLLALFHQFQIYFSCYYILIFLKHQGGGGSTSNSVVCSVTVTIKASDSHLSTKTMTAKSEKYIKKHFYCFVTIRSMVTLLQKNKHGFKHSSLSPQQPWFHSNTS